MKFTRRELEQLKYLSGTLDLDDSFKIKPALFIGLIESVIGLSEALNHYQFFNGDHIYRDEEGHLRCDPASKIAKEAMEKWGVGE